MKIRVVTLGKFVSVAHDSDRSVQYDVVFTPGAGKPKTNLFIKLLIDSLARSPHVR